MNIPFADTLIYGITRVLSARRPVSPVEGLRLERVRRVLLVLTTGLGDAVLSTPVFSALRSALPDADVRLMVRDRWASLFSADPDINGIINYYGKYRRYAETIGALRKFSPDIVLVLHGNDPDIMPLCYFSGARWIVRIPTGGTKYGFLLSNKGRPQDAETQAGRHYIENRLRLLDTLGVPVISPVPRVVLDAAVVQRARGKLDAILEKRPYWVLHPFAADGYKAWPRERVRALLAASDPTQTVVLSGTVAERPELESVASAVGHAIVLAGSLDIGELAVLISGALCVVAPDTGVLHLAAALDRPTVGLYAPTSPALIGPRTRTAPVAAVQAPLTCAHCSEKRCPYVPGNCMTQITGAEVLEALDRALALPA